MVTAALERVERLERMTAHRAAFDEYVQAVLNERGEGSEIHQDEAPVSATDDDRAAARQMRAESFTAGSPRVVA